MIKLVDITFHANSEYTDTSAMLKAQSTSLLYVDEIRHTVDIEVIKHIDNPRTVIQEHPCYRFFRGSNHFFSLPIKTLLYLRRKRPDIILVQGLIFPVQLLAMRYLLGKKVRIMVKHHAELPSKGIKGWFQKRAAGYIHAFLFSSVDNASEWISAGRVGREKVHTLPATYTAFSGMNKQEAREKLGWSDERHYLWVGRLNANKDPFTVFNAFEKYFAVYPGTRLHMVYKTDELLPEVKKRIESSPLLSKNVCLHGCIANTALPIWFSAADVYILSSHAEGGSGALLEAMACACIPIVSNIPSSMYSIGHGKNGLYFTAGDADSLYAQLVFSHELDHNYSQQVVAAFSEKFSLPVITAQLVSICNALMQGE